MTFSLRTVTIDCSDPRALARFWSEATGYGVAADHDGEFVLLEPAGKGAGPALGLQRVPEPKQGKNRVHMDFHTDDRDAEVERLIKLGASWVAEHSIPEFSWIVMRDPAGNEFCVA